MQPIFTIKPNVKKVCLINMIKVAAAVTIIVAVVTYSSSLLDFTILKDAFEIADEELPAPRQVLINFIAASVLAALLTYALTYIAVSRWQYAFYPDRIEVYKNFLIFNTSQLVIPLANVVSITAQKTGEKKLFGLGKIVLGLTSFKQDKIELDDIEQPEYYVPYIQRMLDSTKAQMSASYQFNETVNRTMSGL